MNPAAIIAAGAPSPTPAADATRRIGGFLRGFSIEATRPKPADIEAVRLCVPAGTRVYLSAIAGRPLDEVVAHATAIRTAGLNPVPHVAVRNLESREQVSGLLARLREEADVTHLLAVGGDRPDTAGPFAVSLDLIESGLLQHHGITHVGLAGHPEGHPRVSDDVLDRALRAKVEAAEAGGLTADIVTQFCFEGETIAAWVRRLRDYGVETPVRIGLAGPTNLTTLLKYAHRCGVKASAGGLARHAGRMKRLFGVRAPDDIVRLLAERAAGGALGEVAAHVFSFGDIGATARWAAQAAQGRLTLEGDSGFSVEG